MKKQNSKIGSQKGSKCFQVLPNGLMDQSLQFEEQLFIPDIKSIDINHISGPFFTDYQSLSLCKTLVLHLTLYYKIKPSNARFMKT